MPPALFTSTSTEPPMAPIAAAIRSTWSTSERSPASGTTPAPIPAAAACRTSSRRPTITTLRPARANAPATALPIPVPPPDTTTMPSMELLLPN